MTTIRVAGTLLAAGEDRHLTYRLLPFGEAGSTSVGRVTASVGTVSIPDDVTTLVANLEHDPTRPLARFVSVTESDDGLDATLRVLATQAGDDLLTEVREGVRTGISVELDDITMQAARPGVPAALLAGTLAGAGFVARPAFPSARLAAADTELPEDFPDYLRPSDSVSESVDEVAINGVTYRVRRSTTSTTTVEVQHPEPALDSDDPAAEPERGAIVAATQTTREVDEQDPAEAPSTEQQIEQEEETVQDDEQDRLRASHTATAPAGGVAARRASQRGGVPTSVHAVAQMLAAAHQQGGARQLMAALSDITPAGILGLGQPEYVGELWSGRAYARRIVPLVNHADLTSFKVQGWRWTTKPQVDAYAGNKAAVPSNAPATVAVEIAAQRLAGAHDIDRIYRDFNVAEFFESYFRAMTESYAKKSDAALLTALTTAATVVTTAAANVPANVPLGMTLIVDGALAVLQATDEPPTFAVVAPDLYRGILLTPETNVLGYLNAALGLEDGTIGDGFKIVPNSGVAAGKALVGTKSAATMHELAGSPIRVEAIDLTKAGVDEGVFGYYAVNVHAAAGLALVNKGA